MRAEVEPLSELHDAVVHGRLDAVPRSLAEHAPRPGARGWALAVRAAASLLDASGVRAPSVAEVAACGDADRETRGAAMAACVHLARHCVLAFAPDALGELIEVHAELAHDFDDASEAKVTLALARGWRAWLTGAPSDAELADLEAAARAIGSAGAVLDAAVLRALAADARRDTAEMLAHARRASRMARAESLPAHELLASTVLARARRISRHPHLAIRILGTLEAIATSPFRGWLHWEALLAGDEAAVGRTLAPTPRSRAERAADALARTIRAAIAGDADALDRAAHDVLDRARGVPFAESEALELLAALDPRRSIPSHGSERGGEEIAAWCAARSIVAPPSVHGLCIRIVEDAADASEALVLAAPGERPRRVLGAGARLLDGGERWRLRKTRRRQGRVETLIAVLASAGDEGLEDAECFARTYDLVYAPEVHRSVFDVLLLRARAYVEGAGTIVRGAGRIALHLERSIAVPDPRCAAPVHDRLLRILAREGRATAAEAAQQVGLSVRAVQDALKSLAEEGACVGAKNGRQILYTVEDTTFSEPTQRLALGR
jgi:hypothetical protein